MELKEKIKDGVGEDSWEEFEENMSMVETNRSL